MKWDTKSEIRGNSLQQQRRIRKLTMMTSPSRFAKVSLKLLMKSVYTWTGDLPFKTGSVSQPRDKYSGFRLPALSVYTRSGFLSTSSITHGGKGTLQEGKKRNDSHKQTPVRPDNILGSYKRILFKDINKRILFTEIMRETTMDKTSAFKTVMQKNPWKFEEET